MSLELHDYVLSAECYAVRLMLALLKLGYARVAVDAYPGGGAVPVLIDGDRTLRDPAEIVLHLVRTRDGSWLPAAHEQAILDWLAFAGDGLAPLKTARRIATLGQPGDLAASVREGRAGVVEDALTLQRLRRSAWLVGDQPSVADIAIFPAVMLSHDSGIGHEDYPGINLWQRQVRALPGFIGMPGIPDYV